jgi:hypothetical protein
MAKPLQFTGAGVSCTAQIEKVDRDKIYGWVNTRALDATGELCVTASVLEDGKTLIPAGGFTLLLVSENGSEIARKDLIAKDQNGNTLEIIASSFDAPVELRADVTLENFLDLQVKTVYQLSMDSGKDELLAKLSKGLLAFNFNYRAGYETDTGYLVALDNEIFAIIGRPTQFEFIKLETLAVEEDDEHDEDESLDFGML